MLGGHGYMQLLAGCTHPACISELWWQRENKVFLTRGPNKCQWVCFKSESVCIKGVGRQIETEGRERKCPVPKLPHCCPKQLWHWDLGWMLFSCEYHIWPHLYFQLDFINIIVKKRENIFFLFQTVNKTSQAISGEECSRQLLCFVSCGPGLSPSVPASVLCLNTAKYTLTNVNTA